MRQIRLFDNLFANTLSASLGGANAHIGPSKIEWDRNGPLTEPTVFTDSHIGWAESKVAIKNKILWLLEPFDLHPENYMHAVEREEIFSAIYTHHKVYAQRPGWSFIPFGGAWLDKNDWGIGEKTKNLSLLASPKSTMVGHIMRHEIIKRFAGFIDDIFGDPPIPYKAEALLPYRYSIIVESARYPHYFTEKLIDCFLSGTVPIYWGDPLIGNIFDPTGIAQFSTMEELTQLLIHYQDVGWEQQYDWRLHAIQHNFIKAQDYICAEDWLPL